MAGLETLVSEEPVNWLAPPAATPQPDAVRTDASRVQDLRPAARVSAPTELTISPIPQPLAPLAMPDDWAEFQSWLATDAAVPGTRWSNRRILPHGRQGAKLMVFSLCPEMEDDAAGSLHSGKAGVLLDAMLQSVGLAREGCYLASLALTRPPGGRIDEQELAALVPLLWHHVRLARPGGLLIFGADLTRLMAAAEVAAARGKLLNINQDGVKVEAVATQHPLLLLDRPARKAAAWDSLKRLAQG